MRLVFPAMAALLTLSACGGDGDTEGSTPTETVTVTVTADAAAEDEPAGDVEEGDGSEGGAEGPAVLVVDQPVTIGPDEDGDTAEVTLHSVTYPQPKGDGDAGSLEAGNVFVEVQWRIENVGETDVYGISVYPSYQTDDGQVREAEWEIGLFADYGSKGYEDEMPDSLDPGQFAQGWDIYEVPSEPGQLIFSAGPEEVRVAVDPPA